MNECPSCGGFCKDRTCEWTNMRLNMSEEDRKNSFFIKEYEWCENPGSPSITTKIDPSTSMGSDNRISKKETPIPYIEVWMRVYCAAVSGRAVSPSRVADKGLEEFKERFLEKPEEVRNCQTEFAEENAALIEKNSLS